LCKILPESGLRRTGRRVAIPALVTPGIHDKKQENDKAQEEEDDRAWLAFPKLLKAFKGLRFVHYGAIYTTATKTEAAFTVLTFSCSI
jgi:hypothetical protein